MMKKQFLNVIPIILVLIFSTAVSGYLLEQKNTINIESSQIVSDSACVESATTEMPTASTATLTSIIPTTLSTSTAKKATTSDMPTIKLPESWEDNGIFSAFYSKAYKKLSSMSLEERVGQMILAPCPKVNAVKSISICHLGGFILFEKDFVNKTASDVILTIKSYQSTSEIPMIIAVDEEGGKVVRISGNPLLSNEKFLSPQEIYINGGLAAVRSDTQRKAEILKKYGINVNLAPVADISSDPSDYIYPRTLGRPAQETGNYVVTVVKAMQESGLSSTLKHFPGYGNNVNTHTELAIDKRPLSTFEQSDFIPFMDGINAGVESVLVSHNIVECMDALSPASLSSAVHQILRNKLHFTGVIITDDLAMGAIKSYLNNSDPAVKAVLAGNDMIIINDFEAGYNAIINAVKSGTISQQQIDKAVFRILAWKYAKGIMS